MKKILYSFMFLCVFTGTKAIASYVPKMMVNLPPGTVITIQQDLYIEPNEDNFYFIQAVKDLGDNKRISIMCNISLQNSIKTPQGLLLKAPINIELIDNWGVIWVDLKSNKSIDTFSCHRFLATTDDLIDYGKPSVNELIEALKAVKGSLYIPAPAQQ